MDRLLWISTPTSSLRSSKRRLRYLCSRWRSSFADKLFLSLSSKFLIKCLALLSSPRVVWRELSAPTGTRSFRFSRQLLRWARRFFSSSLWVDLLPVAFLVEEVFSLWFFVETIIWSSEVVGRVLAYPCSASEVRGKSVSLRLSKSTRKYYEDSAMFNSHDHKTWQKLTLCC